MSDETVHLWFNGYDLAPGRTEDEALRWLMQESGEDADSCDGDGWRQWPDDEYLRDEDGSIPIPAETCAQMAQRMIDRWPLLVPDAATRTYRDAISGELLAPPSVDAAKEGT
ncbi:MAG: hypothetical protein JXA90_03165 [Planctomycetes bacterium]|nr:hypothetical protein [Planctomycetota bacterium]